MIALQRRFGYSAAWNMLESVGYQTLLFSHQCALYKTLSATEYGKMGALFSLIYLGIALFNFGLDSSISPFFWYATQSKSNAWRVLLLPIVRQITLLSIIALTTTFGLYMWQVSLPIGILPLLGILFISEALKKTVRTILQCAFKNQVTTAIELATITSYIGTVWLLYHMGYALSLYSLFVPMVLTSSISLIALCSITYQWYSSLSDQSTPKVSMARITQHRLHSYGTQLSHIFFSANFLVPLFAWQFGTEYAAILKLMSYLSYCIHTIVHKVFGLSLQACFAAIKQENITVKKDFFVMTTNYLYQLLYGISIFFVINHQRILTLKSVSLDHSIGMAGYLFIVGTFIENFLVSYEQLYQAEEKTLYISIFNGVNILLLGAFWCVGIMQNPITFLLLFILLRLCTIAGIVFGAFYFWRIKPDIAPQAKPAFCFLALSAFFFLLTM